jgi:hypothetical protein
LDTDLRASYSPAKAAAGCRYSLEEILQKSDAGVETSSGKNPVMVAAGKKAVAARATGSYNFEQHLAGKPESMRQLAVAIHDFIAGLDPAIEVAPKKSYVAYKTSHVAVIVHDGIA